MLSSCEPQHEFASSNAQPLFHITDHDGSCPRHLIELAIMRVFGVAIPDLRAATRGYAKVALARQAAMYLAHTACSLTLTEVGRLFLRDRTTVAHACSVIEDRRDDPVFDHVMELLERIVRELASPHGGRRFNLPY